MTLRTDVVGGVDGLSSAAWDALVPGHDPFLSHAFLGALERHDAVGPRWGWLPRIVTARDADGRLLGAVPMYEKHNSYGELVFDGAWASAYARSGGAYYPKLVVGVPYTPATGARLLVHPEADRGVVGAALIEAALGYARERGMSSLHWLFPGEADTAALVRAGFDWRLGVQFHWFNRPNAPYRDFDDYLGEFASAKRKKLKRERRRVVEQGIAIRRLHGDQVSDAEWAIWHRFYRSTFDRKSGYATLSEAFFRDIGRALGRRVLLVLAESAGRAVAGALMLRSDEVLYGRHWGCDADFHSLHFEACYYQGLDYAIEHRLARFEPGAQGEHKIQRGFRPTSTWSAHWLADPGFDRAVRRFLNQERRLVAEYAADLTEHLPFRHPEAP